MLWKKGLGILLLLAAAWIAAGAAQIALLGEGEAAEQSAQLILAACSGKFEFVERSRLAEVLAEQKLTAAKLAGSGGVEAGELLGADLFAVVTQTGSLVVFETALGFRLADAAVAPEEPDKAAAILERAQAIWESPEKSVFLSVAGVRDIGLPSGLRIPGRRLARELIRELTNQRGIVMLERSYLLRLEREKKLTGRIGRLASASQLLVIELLPGREPKEFELVVRLVGSDGGTLFSMKGFSSEPEMVSRLRDGVLGRLKLVPAAEDSDRRAEAARFAAEAEWTVNWEERLEKLLNAFLLEPENRRYRRRFLEQFSYFTYLNSPPSPDILLERFGLILELAGERFGEDCDDWSDDDRDERGWLLLAAANHLDGICLRRAELTPAQLEIVRDGARKVRASWRLDREMIDPHEKRDQVQWRLAEITSELIAFRSYCDDADFTAEAPEDFRWWFRRASAVGFTKEGLEHFRDFFPQVMGMAARLPLAGRKAFEQEFSARLRSAGVGDMRRAGVALELASRLRSAPREQAEAVFRKALDEIRQSAPEWEKQLWFWEQAIQCAVDEGDRPALRAAFENTREPGARARRISGLPAAVEALRGRLVQLRQLPADKRYDSGLWAGFDALRRSDCLNAALLEEFNSGWRFERIWPEKHRTGRRMWQVADALDDGEGGLYLATLRPDALVIHALGPDGKERKRIGYIPLGEFDPPYRLRPDGEPAQESGSMRSSGDFLMVLGYGQLALLPQKGGHSRVISELPGPLIDAVVLGERLYTTNGRGLFSCNLEGGDRKVEFSSDYEDQPLLMRDGDRLKVGICRLVPEGGELILPGPNGIWKFNPARPELRLLWLTEAHVKSDCPWRWCVRDGNILTLTGASGNSAGVQQYDLASGEMSEFRSFPVRSGGGGVVLDDWLFLPGWAGSSSAVLPLNAQEEPDWIFPMAIGFFRRGKGVWMVTDYQVFRMQKVVRQ